MDRARQAVQEFTSKKGHHTDVSEAVAPAVVSETIKPSRHEEVQQAVDREVHQDHYHTTVQPIQHQEVLPEKHHHQMKDVIHKEFDHGDHESTTRRLEQERAQFANTSTTHETKLTQSAAPVIEGEHVHHHVHETVQPIIHKETITPEVIHTTVPVHETHHATSQHHGISTLPMKTLDSFTSGGGILKGGQTASHEEYEGAPRAYNRDLMSNPTEADLQPGQTGLDGPSSHHTGGTNISAGKGTSGIGRPGESGYQGLGGNENYDNYDGRTGSGLGQSGSRTGGGLGHTGSRTGDGLGNTGSNTVGRDDNYGGQTGGGTDGYGSNTNTSTNTTTNTSTEHKPSMMDKIKRAI